MQKSLLILVVLQILALVWSPRSSVRLQEISHLDTSGWSHDVALDGSNIYVSDRQGGFLIFDRTRDYKETRYALPIRDVISLSPNLGMPVLAARFDGLVLLSPSGQITDRYSNGDIANAVEVRGNYAFAAYGLQGLVVVRLTKGHAGLAATLPTKGWSHDIRLSGNQALLADWDYGLRVIDIRDPEKPAEISSLPSPATCISLAVKQSGDKRMLALAEGNAGVALALLDSEGRPSLISRNYLGLNPADPIHPEAGGWVHSVAWAGRYLFAANWKRGLTVLDTLDSKNPRVILQVPTSGTALGVKTRRQSDGSYLIFLADGNSGLRIFRFRY
jgi:hypothetical protein